MNPPLEDADVETASAGYASRFDSGVGRWMLERQLLATLDLLSDRTRTSILDVGGGHGQLAPDLARRGHRVSVLASSEAAVSAALKPHVRSGQVRLVTGNLREPPVAPRSFDVVLCFRMLAHAHDLPGLIAGLARPAERSIIVDYATSRSFNAVAGPLFGAKQRVEKNTRPFRVLPNDELEHLFLETGCRSTGRRPQFFWPMALHRALRSALVSRALEAPATLLGMRTMFGSPVIARFDRV